jgi:8-oxo-dGTP pyrophosphatase MutT (NUDIX family)
MDSDDARSEGDAESMDECHERDERAAGGVVYRKSGGGVEVAIAEQRDRVTSAPTIRLPKGRIDPGESLEQTALREVAEETGLRTRIVESLGSTRYVYDEPHARVSKEVHYFLLEWLEGEARPADGEMEHVYWCSLDEAARTLTFESERRAIDRARDALVAHLGAGGV